MELVNAFWIMKFDSPVSFPDYARHIVDGDEMVLVMKNGEGHFHWGKAYPIGRNPDLFDVPVRLIDNKHLVVFAKDELPSQKIAKMIKNSNQITGVLEKATIPITPVNITDAEVFNFKCDEYLYSYVLKLNNEIHPVVVEVDYLGLTSFSMTNNLNVIRKLIDLSLEIYEKNTLPQTGEELGL